MSSFKKRIRVRFSDEDHAQIVYFPRFFDFFHRTFEDFFEDTGHSYRQCLAVERIGWPAVYTQADFKHPIRFGDHLDVEVVTSRIGERSATFQYTGTKAEDGSLIVLGTVTVACLNMDTFTSQPIPEKYRALFASIYQAPVEKRPPG